MTVYSFDALPTGADPRRLVETINRHNEGKINVVYGPFTLTANAASTTLTDSRISGQSWIGLSPQTSNAAASVATTYVSAQVAGSATVDHANNAQTDKTFNVLIIG